MHRSPQKPTWRPGDPRLISTLRDDLPTTRLAQPFDIPLPKATKANLKHPDKAELLEIILALRAEGWSYRQIGREVGLHWTRVGQIVKSNGAS